MSRSRLTIRDLPLPIRAAKSDWLVADHWIGFTPQDGSLNARAQCMSTIAAQAAGGYIIEYITQSFGEPNAGFDRDPTILAERQAHRAVAGRFAAVHKLRPTARALKEIAGEAEYERIQDMWAASDKRYRWSVAFPITESYSIPGRPLAAEVLGPAAMKRVFAHPSSTLRPLTDAERTAIADLPLAPRSSRNGWIGVEDEAQMAARSDIDPVTRRAIERDLAEAAMEGMTEERRAKVRLRAAWLADRFVTERRRAGSLRCDECGFDAAAKAAGTDVRARTLLDAHHKNPLDEGVRYTTTADFALLCPTCHRFAHAVMRLDRGRGAALAENPAPAVSARLV